MNLKQIKGSRMSKSKKNRYESIFNIWININLLHKVQRLSSEKKRMSSRSVIWKLLSLRSNFKNLSLWSKYSKRSTIWKKSFVIKTFSFIKKKSKNLNLNTKGSDLWSKSNWLSKWWVRKKRRIFYREIFLNESNFEICKLLSESSKKNCKSN